MTLAPNTTWPVLPLAEKVEIARRGKSPTYAEQDEGVWVINQECVTTDGIALRPVKFQLRSADPIPDQFFLERDDILLNSTGTGTIGRVALFETSTKPCFPDTHVTLIRTNPQRMRAQFLKYYFESTAGQRYLEAFCYSGSTNQVELSRRFLLKAPIPSPSLEEQDSIVSLLALVDRAVAAARDSIAKTERLQKALMQQLLSGRRRPDGTELAPADLQQTKLGLIPRTWTVASVKDFGSVSTGKTPPTDTQANFGTEYQFITPGDLGASKWIRKTERGLSSGGAEYAGIIPERAVCVVCIGATIGKIGLTTKPACTNQQINTVVCSSHHSPEYLYYALKYRSRHLQVIAGVNATPQLNKTEFSKYKLPMPATLEEECDIRLALAVFDDLIEAKLAKIEALQRLKKSLMQNLLTGKVRLPAIETKAVEAAI